MLITLGIAPVDIFTCSIRFPVPVLVYDGEVRFNVRFLHLPEPCHGTLVTILPELQVSTGIT